MPPQGIIDRGLRWITTGAGLLIMALAGEWLCVQRELAEIPLSEWSSFSLQSHPSRDVACPSLREWIRSRGDPAVPVSADALRGRVDALRTGEASGGATGSSAPLLPSVSGGSITPKGGAGSVTPKGSAVGTMGGSARSGSGGLGIEMTSGSGVQARVAAATLALAGWRPSEQGQVVAR